MFIFYSNDQGDTLPVDPNSDLFSVNNPSQGDILSYDGSHFTNTNILSGSNIDLINIDPSNLTGTIPYNKLPNLAEITLSGDAVPPYISSITPITPTGDQTIEIIGEYFSPITQFNIPGVTVNSLEVRSPNKIIANISKSGLSGNILINLNNGGNSNSIWQEGIKSITIYADPFLANTLLFLKGIGSNNSTNIIDSSLAGKTITASGNTVISTAQSKYNNSSIYLDGTGDFAETNNFTDTLADFTFESWFYLVGAGQSTMWGGKNTADQEFAISGSQVIIARAGVAFDLLLNYTTALNTWNHIAFSRVGNSLRIFYNGILIHTLSYSLPISINGGFIGKARDGNRQYSGYLSHIRITNIARYTANFNPETDTYLNI